MESSIKTIVLLSGGLDSSLSLKLVKEQGIEIMAIKFTSPLCTCDQKGKCYAKEIAFVEEVPLKIISKGKDYLSLLRNPRFGYGRGMNPCIDCRIYMLRRAKKLMQEIGASFIVTGEVLGQRPMSQYRKALETIERESELKGKVLRPLSARLLSPSEPEKKGWVDRKKLLDIEGRSRKKQLKIAVKKEIKDFACAAGGCLLTQQEFANKLRDVMKYNPELTWKDISLLKVGRHFRIGTGKIVVGRNSSENKFLLKGKNNEDFVFEVPDSGSPITILQGEKSKENIRNAAGLTAGYCREDKEKILVRYGKDYLHKEIYVEPYTKRMAAKFNLTLK